jgi:hypothetical protein
MQRRVAYLGSRLVLEALVSELTRASLGCPWCGDPRWYALCVACRRLRITQLPQQAGPSCSPHWELHGDNAGPLGAEVWLVSDLLGQGETDRWGGNLVVRLSGRDAEFVRLVVEAPIRAALILRRYHGYDL